MECEMLKFKCVRMYLRSVLSKRPWRGEFKYKKIQIGTYGLKDRGNLI